ncbi:MAG: ribulose-phosphate 3-epimerase [Lachnospiraceae bacterium]|nr:ribulose-phosphate 3-epimerase [Lachnospiraceae bacterium]
MEYKLSPSVLAADFARLGEEAAAVEAAGAQYLHLDVMDGLFAPSLSIGLPVIRSLRKVSGLVFDVHLMIEDPERYLADFAAAGADILTVHQEACRHLDRTLDQIHALGCRTGVALNPATPFESLRWVLPKIDMILLMTVNPGFGGQKYIPCMTGKIASLRSWLAEQGYETDIQVDGGISLDNAEEVLQAGANILVAGLAVFGGDPGANTGAFLKHMNQWKEGGRA